MHPHRESLEFWKRLCITLGSVAGSALLAFAFEPLLGESAHFLPFTLAVILSAWYGGLAFGLVATAAGFLITDYFFVFPIHHLLPVNSPGWALLALFLLMGISISILQSTLAQATEALRASRELIELAAEAGRIGFAESLGGERIRWTPEMERLFGLQPGMFEGTLSDWVKRIHPNDRNSFQGERIRQIERSVPELKFEYRAILPDGQVRWLEGRRRIILSPSGLVKRIVSANVDITDRHELEQALRVRTEELKKSNQDLERFAYTVAHDLQSPLRAVETLTQLVLKRTRRELDAESTNLLDLVVSSADRMRHLIQNMLELARVNHAPTAYEPVDASAVAKVAAEHAEAGRRDAVISIGALPIIRADENQILRLFENLIGNALKYCGDRRPEVDISFTAEGEDWIFAVSDNGIGIDPADHERIFREFERLHSASRYEGSGIGLSICREIVERHGGRIWVESQVGQGSTFRFTIPKDPTASASVLPKPMQSEAAGPRNRAAAG